MSAQPARSLDSLSRQWSDLAERRRAYYVELYDSGRWRHYFDEAELLARMRDVVAAAQAWRELADRNASFETPPLKQAS